MTIKPEIKQVEIHDYILEHMLKDLASIATVLEKKNEDVLILIHYLLSDIINNHTAAKMGMCKYFFSKPKGCHCLFVRFNVISNSS